MPSVDSLKGTCRVALQSAGDQENVSVSAQACPGEVWLDFTGESVVSRHQLSCRVLTFCENDRSGCSDDWVGLPTLGTLVP